VVGFTFASDWVFGQFHRFYRAWPWAVLLTTPLITAGIVWATLRFFPGAGGSGIPQIKAALHPALPEERRFMFASLRLTVAKIGLGAAGFAAGLSIGREGPSVQVAAGVMQHARRWLSPGTTIDARALLVAGGAAGIAAAFNTPLAGVMFAIEELSRQARAAQQRFDHRRDRAGRPGGRVGLRQRRYFGVIHAPRRDWTLLGPGLSVTLLSGYCRRAVRAAADRLAVGRAKAPFRAGGRAAGAVRRRLRPGGGGHRAGDGRRHLRRRLRRHPHQIAAGA
jgi:hypothetical protein